MSFKNKIRSSTAYWCFSSHIATPLLRKLDPETAHNLTVKLLEKNLGPCQKHTDPQILNNTVFGYEFTNPLGVAPGLDKQAQAMQGLLSMGFGFVEVGGVTPEPQAGNPKPRIFRLVEDRAIINRYGLNSEGQSKVAARLASFNAKGNVGLIGVNLAKNTTSTDIIGDYKKVIRALAAHVDYLVLNISCPNVAWTKQLSNAGDEIKQMVSAIKEERDNLSGSKPALLVKLGPDMNTEAKEHRAEMALNCNIDGLIVSNTTSTRAPDLRSKYKNETGGLSGRPIKQAAVQSLRDMYKLTQGKIPIIGVGGIESSLDAYARIRSGASLLQIYSALVYQGPKMIPEIKNGLAKLLQRDGFKSISEAIGVDVV